MNEERTAYQAIFEKHCNAVLGIFRYLITRIADEAVEIASRVVALAAPLPNAISMYNISQKELGYSVFAASAFAVTLELAVFFAVEVALRMWDRYLENPLRNKLPFQAALYAVGVVVLVVMVLVYKLEPHGVMVLLPIVSLCSFVGLGLKRWDERNGDKGVKYSVKRSVKGVKSPVNTLHTEFTPRQINLLTLLSNLDGQPDGSVNKSALARELNISRPTLNKEFDILQASGKLSLNGHVVVNGGGSG